MTAHWSKKLDPYWSVEDMMKTNAFFHTLAAVNNLNTECYVIQRKKCKQKRVLLDLLKYTELM